MTAYPEGSWVSLLLYLREHVAPAGAAWKSEIGDDPPESVATTLFLPTPEATPFALTLYGLDRELRRSVRLVESEYRTKRTADTIAAAYSPLPVSEGGLALDRARAGSLISDLSPYGAVAAFLLSDPVQLVLTVRELLGWTGQVITRVRRAGSPDIDIVGTPDQSVSVRLSKRGVRVDHVPEGTRVKVRHRTRSGAETTVKIDRS
jgi:hypothetical protein